MQPGEQVPHLGKMVSQVMPFLEYHSVDQMSLIWWKEQNVSWIVNTTSGGFDPKLDEIRMRTEAVNNGIPITTTLNGLQAAVSGLEALKSSANSMDVRTIQEYHKFGIKLKYNSLKT